MISLFLTRMFLSFVWTAILLHLPLIQYCVVGEALRKFATQTPPTLPTRANPSATAIILFLFVNCILLTYHTQT